MEGEDTEVGVQLPCGGAGASRCESALFSTPRAFPKQLGILFWGEGYANTLLSALEPGIHTRSEEGRGTGICRLPVPGRSLTGLTCEERWFYPGHRAPFQSWAGALDHNAVAAHFSCSPSGHLQVDLGRGRLAGEVFPARLPESSWLWAQSDLEWLLLSPCPTLTEYSPT